MYDILASLAHYCKYPTLVLLIVPPDCKNCEFLQQQNEELHKEIEALKAQLLKVQLSCTNSPVFNTLFWLDQNCLTALVLLVFLVFPDKGKNVHPQKNETVYWLISRNW